MLAIDTVATRCSIAIRSKNNTISLIGDHDTKNTDVALTMLLELCQQSNTKLSELEHLIVTNGPGSFTGVRIGVVICQMLSLANNCKIYPVSSMLALVSSANLGIGRYAVVIDARMNEYYYAEYEQSSDGFKCITAEQIVKQIPNSAFDCDFRIADIKLDQFNLVNMNAERMLDLLPFLNSGMALPTYLRSPV